MGWGLDASDLWGDLSCRKESVHLVERQTGGKQVLWPDLDAESRQKPPEV